MSTTQVKFKKIASPGDVPSIVNFVGGRPSDIFFDPSNEDKCLNFSCYISSETNNNNNNNLPSSQSKKAATTPNNTKRQQRNLTAKKIIVGENSVVEYVGNPLGETSSSDNVYFLGVFDHKKQKMDVVNADFITLKPTIKKLKRKYQQQEEEEKGSGSNNNIKKLATAEQRGLARNDLVNSFGGKKKRQELSSLERNKVHMDKITKNIEGAVMNRLEEKAEQASSMEEIQKQADMDRPIPPHDIHATDPASAYPLEKIITSEEFAQLQQPAKVFSKSTKGDLTNWAKDCTYPVYVISKLKELPSSPKQRNRMAKLLMYLDYLIRFRQLRPVTLNNPDKLKVLLNNIPEVIRERLMQSFTHKSVENGGKLRYTIPPKCSDLIVSHILVLILHIEGFELASGGNNQIFKDLKIGSKKGVEFLRGLGCVPDGKKYKLKAPLEFPKPRKGRMN
eukprot:Nk52_evm1s2470 gene=Nk52_evmTU1s2470